MAAPAFRKSAKVETLHLATPYSVQAEQAVIGALIHDPQETHALVGDRLAAPHFYDPFCRAVFGKALELLNGGEPIDIVILAARLEGLISLGQEEIAQNLEKIYMAFPTSENVHGWVDLIVQKAVERQLASTGERLVQIAHAQEISPDDKLAEAHRLLADVGSTMASDSMVTAEAMVAETMQTIEMYTAMSGALTGLSTGIEGLDEATTGLHGGELVIVAGRPAMGKTSFALTLAKAITAHSDPAKRKGVAMFSLEMGTSQIGMRWLGVLHDIPISHMRRGRVSAVEWNRLHQALADSADIPFFLDKSPSLSMEQIAAKTRRMARERGLGAMVVDYLQLIDDNSGRLNSTRTERVGQISRSLKQLARELNIPVIALSQLSRSVETRVDKRPMMSDLRESGSIEQDADLIMFLYRDEVYNANTQDIGMAEVIIGKQRNGPPCTVRVAFDAPTTRFRDGPPMHVRDAIDRNFPVRHFSEPASAQDNE